VMVERAIAAGRGRSLRSGTGTPVSVTVSVKSAASRASACERRKSAHVAAPRSGAGSMPASQDLPDR
jgi:hypothetical protein